MSVSGAAPRTMWKESNISANESRSRSGPPSRLAATQEPERNAVAYPAPADSFALSPSHTAGMTTKSGLANSARRRSGADMMLSFQLIQRHHPSCSNRRFDRGLHLRGHQPDTTAP